MIIPFLDRRIGSKILVGVAICLLLGMTAIALYVTGIQERGILEQNQAAMLNLTEATSQSVQTIMLAGYADIAKSLAKNLQKIPGVLDFRILHREGFEAFNRNATIEEVNERIGDEEFIPRDEEIHVDVLSRKHDGFRQTIDDIETVQYVENAPDGQRLLTFLVPIENRKECQRCHGSDHDVRGVVKLTTSLAGVNATVRDTWLGVAVGLVVVTVAVIAVVGWLVRRVSMPITLVAKEMGNIATGDGDLTVALPVRGRDEVAELSRGFNTFVRKVHDTIRDVASSAIELKNLVGGVSATASDTLAAAERQNAHTQRVAGAVASVAASVDAVSVSTDGAMTAAREVDSQASAGKHDVDETIAAIRDLKADLDGSGKAMVTLTDDVEKIGSILTMIQGIADQTNLLALNASIEAARAGEHGRGFAVVADEVRQLAARTRQSTVDISALINGLQSNSRAVGVSMNQCIGKADTSMQLADRSAESLVRITQAAAHIVEINTSISNSMDESSAETEEINRAMDSIGHESKKTFAQVDAAHRQSAELARLVEQLEQLVGQFKLKVS